MRCWRAFRASRSWSIADVSPRRKDVEGSTARRLVQVLVRYAAFAFVVGAMCEIGARLDDWFFEDVPVLSSPSFMGLFAPDENGMRHGIPHARWKKVRLNNLGLRGPDVPIEPHAGCARWMFLGASETFGDPAQSNREFPARVLARMSTEGCHEILNTAFPAFDVRSITRYYQFFMARYRPNVVFIYPPTHFYLSNEIPPRNLEPPNPSAAHAESPNPSLLEQSRFFERLKDTAEVPAIIQKRRVARWIADAEKNRAADWHFATVPEDRLDMLSSDLRDLIALIRANGAEPVLMTHAVRVATPPRAEDESDLYGMRVYLPRASEEVIARFEYAAAERTRSVARETGTRLVDVASRLSGRRDRFVDLVHYSSEGNDEVAGLIVDAMKAR
jgi:hypothetical protein